jgi:hypothetical protein
VVDAFLGRESDILWVKNALDNDSPHGDLSIPLAVEAMAV